MIHQSPDAWDKTDMPSFGRPKPKEIDGEADAAAQMEVVEETEVVGEVEVDKNIQAVEGIDLAADSAYINGGD